MGENPENLVAEYVKKKIALRRAGAKHLKSQAIWTRIEGDLRSGVLDYSVHSDLIDNTIADVQECLAEVEDKKADFEEVRKKVSDSVKAGAISKEHPDLDSSDFNDITPQPKKGIKIVVSVDKLIEVDLSRLQLDYYEKFIALINTCAIHEDFFKFLPVLLRNLLENVLYEIFREFLSPVHKSVFYDVNHHHRRDFSELISILNILKERELDTYQKIPQVVIDKLNYFKDQGNYTAHEIVESITPTWASERKGDLTLLFVNLLQLYTKVQGKHIILQPDTLNAIAKNFGNIDFFAGTLESHISQLAKKEIYIDRGLEGCLEHINKEIYNLMSKNRASILENIELAIEIYGGIPRLLEFKADLLFLLGKWQEALETYSELIELLEKMPLPRRYLTETASGYLKEKEITQKLRDFWANKGKLNKQLNHWEEALICFQNSVKLDVVRDSYTLHISECNIALGNVSPDIIDTIQKYLDHNQDPSIKPVGLFFLIVYYLKKKDYEYARIESEHLIQFLLDIKTQGILTRFLPWNYNPLLKIIEQDTHQDYIELTRKIVDSLEYRISFDKLLNFIPPAQKPVNENVKT